MTRTEQIQAAMTYTEAKSKILAARKLTETSPFKLERGYVYASWKEIHEVIFSSSVTPFKKSLIGGIISSHEKHIWGIDSQSRLVRI